MKKINWFKKIFLTSDERKFINEGYEKEARVEAEPVAVTYEKPYLKIISSAAGTTVILNNGVALTSHDGSKAFIDQIIATTTEEEIYFLFKGTPVAIEKTVTEDEKLENKVVEDNQGILENHPEFEVRGKAVFLKDVDLELPALVKVSFIEILEKIRYTEKSVGLTGDTTDLDELKESFEALKFFWMWSALNPIENSRLDLLRFIKKNDITITTNGLLLMYRRVVKLDKVDTAFVEFVSNAYAKVKKWKKNPANYIIYKKDGVLIFQKNDVDATDLEDLGNLKENYLELPNRQIRTFTDNHSHTKDIRIGQVYREDEEKIDLNSSVECSSGLHVGSRSFGFDGFGDVGVLALVNPMFVRSVPHSDAKKMRVSEMFIVGAAELHEYDELVENGDVSTYSDTYCMDTLDELKTKLVVQGRSTPVNQDVVVNVLKNRVKQLV